MRRVENPLSILGENQLLHLHIPQVTAHAPRREGRQDAWAQYYGCANAPTAPFVR